MVEYLLENGANFNKMVRIGGGGNGWSGSITYSIFSNLPSIINQFSSEKLKIKFIEILVKYGFDINQGKRQSYSRGTEY